MLLHTKKMQHFVQLLLISVQNSSFRVVCAECHALFPAFSFCLFNSACDLRIIDFIAAKVPLDNILYLGGPNIASEIYNKEYANARICGTDKWRKPLAKFLRQPHFIVWDNSDLITHEVMGGLKNVYAIGAGKLCSYVPLLLPCFDHYKFVKAIHCSKLWISLPP